MSLEHLSVSESKEIPTPSPCKKKKKYFGEDMAKRNEIQNELSSNDQNRKNINHVKNNVAILP